MESNKNNQIDFLDTLQLTNSDLGSISQSFQLKGTPSKWNKELEKAVKLYSKNY